MHQKKKKVQDGVFSWLWQQVVLNPVCTSSRLPPSKKVIVRPPPVKWIHMSGKYVQSHINPIIGKWAHSNTRKGHLNWTSLTETMWFMTSSLLAIPEEPFLPQIWIPLQPSPVSMQNAWCAKRLQIEESCIFSTSNMHNLKHTRRKRERLEIRMSEGGVSSWGILRSSWASVSDDDRLPFHTSRFCRFFTKSCSC